MPSNATGLKRIAIVGAGPAGLMAAERLSQFDYEIHVFEQKPSAARKFLMAGKTGLNISHAEPLPQFIQRYDAAEWLAPWIEACDAVWIQAWMKNLGVASYVGSSGRVFPIEMKAAPLLRAWLKRLLAQQVQFHYRHQVVGLKGKTLRLKSLKTDALEQAYSLDFDAIILATGGVSWPQLGSDGAWQQWLSSDEISPFQASNAGVCRSWSSFMQPIFGQPLKRVTAWVAGHEKSIGDIVISHYGLESGLIYKQGRALRQQRQAIVQSQGSTEQRMPNMTLYLDLLPELTESQLLKKIQPQAKQSTANLWRKAGLDSTKSALLRELIDKSKWSDSAYMAKQMKQLKIELTDFRPIEEAISCAGGVQQQALDANLQLKSNPRVFCCGEMLDWDAPTGGYLLTACFATGRAAGEAVHQYLETA